MCCSSFLPEWCHNTNVLPHQDLNMKLRKAPGVPRQVSWVYGAVWKVIPVCVCVCARACAFMCIFLVKTSQHRGVSL